MTDALIAQPMRSADWAEARIVRYADLKPCYNAFIDCRTPGSEAKENFTIIGPGVSENPNQHVHIAEPHGFNIGGARQPPHCVNSQHSHDTAEVFVVHSGDWRFDLGEHGDDAQVELHPGDTISLPTGMFRGFTNIGSDVGYLWAVLGKDNPGRVTWAPKVFEMAQDFGLVLLESGRLVDTKAGETLPEGARPMSPTSADDAARLHRANADEAARMVVRDAAGPGKLIGPDAPLDWPHGFMLERVDLAAGERVEMGVPSTPEVLFVHRGTMQVAFDDASATLVEGDTMTVPLGMRHILIAESEVVAYIVRGA